MADTKIIDITIENIKGLEKHTTNLNMIPNKPSLLVAPNGSGKSSFAIAFQSLMKGKLELSKENFHNGDENLKPKINLRYSIDGNEKEFCANSTSNDISKNFGIAVINNRIKSDLIKSEANNRMVYGSKLSIDPIILEPKIPSKASLKYNFEEIQNIKLKRKIIPSINDLLANSKLYSIFPIEEFSNIKNVTKNIEECVNEIKKYHESKDKVDDIIEALKLKIIPTLKSLPKLDIIANIIRQIEDEKDEYKLYLKSMQILLLYEHNRKKFKECIIYHAYRERKKSYESLFASLNRTWQNIKPKEEKGKLLIKIPFINRLSNGERDIIVFLAMLEKARLSLKKDNNILIIDEVFDYLDDANLVAAQYYISEFIKQMKITGRNIFPIILTHLNPDFYRTYAFKDMKVYYLKILPYPQKSNIMMALLRKREELEDNREEEDIISKYMLHFHNNYTVDISNVLNQEQKDAKWTDIIAFKRYCSKQFDKYVKLDKFCPLALCVILREWIESYCYNNLPEDKREIYLSKHGTKNKLKFADENETNYPEIFDLLGLIYNDSLHAPDKKDLPQILYSRFQNNTIRTMISYVREIVEQNAKSKGYSFI